MKVLSPAVLLVIVCCTGFGAGPGNEDAKFRTTARWTQWFPGIWGAICRPTRSGT
jgi:uncharacterized membrane protein YdcZ (DUF606 family)